MYVSEDTASSLPYDSSKIAPLLLTNTERLRCEFTLGSESCGVLFGPHVITQPYSG